MKEVLAKIKNVATWVILIALLSCIGIATENPKVMIPAYAVFFALVFAGFYLYVKSSRRRTLKSSKTQQFIAKAIGYTLVLLALLVPVYVLGNVQFRGYESTKIGFGAYAIAIIGTIVELALAIFAIRLINLNREKNKGLFFIGYLLILVAACVPGLVMLQFDSSTNALGTAYFAAVTISILTWLGLGILTKHPDEL